ncbi:hypothetical protein B0H17DRAFT_1157762 [Mycena rosella]|uniref:O-methyltransferase C-terminal domain-containing protein n=1 Tax=Mycena rosella TaxID=1033263 RepID=A0AAD7DYA2_MYCRO|nr:hypothetical protein B0H17DRAFT_1157762 [Mycena rosella]
MASTLIELCDLISSSVAAVDSRCKALSRTYPDMNNPDNAEEDENLLQDIEITAATSVALAASAQLMQHPSRTIFDESMAAGIISAAFLLSAALGVVAASSTAEIIREAGPEGSRVLRPLTTRHIFREVSPGVFAHNRISALLDTGKSSQAVLAAPEDKYHGARGSSALVGMATDDSFKAAAYIRDVVLHPDGQKYHDEFDTPLNRAFNAHIDLFSWYELPENRVRFRRFGMAVNVTRASTLIVDVGGGIGSTSLEIALANPTLRLIVQDKETYWEREFPTALAAGRVSFQAHDFFTPQPVKHADMFILRLLFQILKHLRDAAKETTKLIVLECMMSLVCRDDGSYDHIPGVVPDFTPPKPLLANMGIVGMVPYLVDMQIMAILNGCERTFPNF